MRISKLLLYGFEITAFLAFSINGLAQQGVAGLALYKRNKEDSNF